VDKTQNIIPFVWVILFGAYIFEVRERGHVVIL